MIPAQQMALDVAHGVHGVGVHAGGAQNLSGWLFPLCMLLHAETASRIVK